MGKIIIGADRKMNKCLMPGRTNCYLTFNESYCFNPEEKNKNKQVYRIKYREEECPMAKECKIKAFGIRKGVHLTEDIEGDEE